MENSLSPLIDRLDIVCFAWSPEQRFCLWFSGETDGFLTEGGSLQVFPSADAARAYVQLHPDLPCAASVVTYDLDRTWRMARGQEPPDPGLALEIWNITTDLAESIGAAFTGSRRDALTDHIYEKLFYGSNLPAVNRSGKHYTPLFTPAERKRLLEILTDCHVLIRRSCFPSPENPPPPRRR